MRPQTAGEFSLQPEGELALVGIYPAGVYSHSLTAKHPAKLTSDDYVFDADSVLWLRVIGDGDSSVRYVVQNYPRDGTVYPVARLSNQWRWQRYDIGYWQGDELHIELATGQDAPLLVKNNPRSWFGIREAAIIGRDQGAPPDSVEHIAPLLAALANTPPRSVADLTDAYQAVITSAVHAWKTDQLTDAQALLLDACLNQGILPNQVAALSTAQPLLAEYRRLENAIPEPRRVPGLEETVGRDQPCIHVGITSDPATRSPAASWRRLIRSPTTRS